MATNIIMPQLGLTMTEGTVTKWLKGEGDSVKTGEVIVEISTDKINNQVEATVDGVVLKIMVREGEVAPVKEVLAIVGEPNEKITFEAPPVQQPTLASAETPMIKITGEWVKASPAAKKLARDKGVDLALVTATGPEGRIVERDVKGYLEDTITVKSSPLAAKLATDLGVDLIGLHKDSRIMKEDVLAAIKPETVIGAERPLSGMRKVIAERMSRSWTLAPHVHYNFEVDMTAVAELKQKMALAMENKFSFTEFIVKCAAQVLMEYKIVNSSIMDGNIEEHDYANIGVAVALDNGLIVPVIKNVQQKSLKTIKEEIAVLGAKARQGGLTPEEITGGTFTVSNLGMYGVDSFSPIINQPESAILGVCRVVKKPVVVNDEIVIRQMTTLCLGADHRLVDGAVAAQFVKRMKELLENPLVLLA